MVCPLGPTQLTAVRGREATGLQCPGGDRAIEAWNLGSGGGGAVSTHGAHCAGCPGHPFELFHSAATNGPEGVVVGQASGLGTS